ncbi:uncharacterized protein BXIN_0029 [Babesia sp. Xinjiang]|uniref:uncharacterized protein n=1 Tax=Babesia sp. Xinjiang TaxID=462227 RepID=UPI000A24B9E3|nr:uncharacterized protein BXIN_0029 [Babesia sp. Xinjiang]ORM39747.1 hypothetical protein BXIN_0029 [Babesia sp. Xinjiang]
MANPVEAYRKLQKKREREKNRKGRQEARDAARLVQDPEKLKKELDELSHKSIIGRINDTDAERKAKLEKLWQKHSANLAVAAVQPPEDDTSVDDSKSDSSSSGDDSDEEETKCVIQIAGKPILKTDNTKRKLKRDDVQDECTVESIKCAPPMPPNTETVSGNTGQNVQVGHTTGFKRHTSHVNQGVQAPRPKPIGINPNIQHIPPPPPPPPPPKKKVAIELPQGAAKEAPSFPLNSYFVPNQLRINQGKK